MVYLVITKKKCSQLIYLDDLGKILKKLLQSKSLQNIASSVAYITSQVHTFLKPKLQYGWSNLTRPALKTAKFYFEKQKRICVKCYS